MKVHCTIYALCTYQVKLIITVMGKIMELDFFYLLFVVTCVQLIAVAGISA